MSENKNNKTPKNKQKELLSELKKAQSQWHQDKKILEQKKKELGYKHVQLKELLGETFIDHQLNQGVDNTIVSALIKLKDDYQNLIERYKQLWPEDYVVKELNKKHAIVHTGQTYVLTEKNHRVFGGKDFSLESRQSFRMYYEDEVVVCLDGKKRAKADIWLKSPSRRKYSDIIFDPTISAQQATKKKFYNMWKGFAKEPKKGDCSKYWEHVENNICSGNKKAYEFVRKWASYIFQHPDQVHTALVVCGSQGVGKNSFVEPLGVLLGSHYVLLSNISELVSNFNFHLKNAVLIHANEAFWGGNKKDLGTLKAMITEETCLIEGKGKDRIMVRNYKHVIISSNEDWPVHLDPDDRRFFVLHVSNKCKEDTQYFKALHEQLNQKGYEALLYDLLNENLEGFNPRRLPNSPYAFELKICGANSAQKYIYEMLLEDQLGISEETIISKNKAYQTYKLWCENNEEKIMQKNFFSMALKKLIPSIKNIRPTTAEGRQRMYKFPSFKQAREEFCKSFKETEQIWDR